MRTSKFAMAVFAFIIASGLFADPSTNEPKPKWKPVDQIEHLLRDADLVIQRDEIINVFFSVSKEKRIEHINVAAPDPAVNEFVRKRLENRKLYGKTWRPGIVYELPVRLETGR